MDTNTFFERLIDHAQAAYKEIPTRIRDNYNDGFQLSERQTRWLQNNPLISRGKLAVPAEIQAAMAAPAQTNATQTGVTEHATQALDEPRAIVRVVAEELGSAMARICDRLR